MNPAARVLVPFLAKLRPWDSTIRRSAYLQDLSMTVFDTGLEVTATWNGFQWKKVFTNQELLGHTSSLSPLAWSIPKKPCYWARQIISAILNQRGV
jgi:hypothetical protein